MQSSLNVLVTVVILTIRLCICAYNLIDEYPSCIDRGYCAYAKPWNIDSIHPNSDERITMVFRNIARLQPTAFKNSIYGKHRYGHYGPQTDYACAAKPQTNPFYWLSEANQVCRFHQYAGYSCPSKQSGHNTCPEYCNLFPSVSGANQCGYATRSAAFLQGTGAKYGGEGLWGGNMGYASEGHCGLVFNPDYDYIGIGWYPDAPNGVTNLGIIYTPPSGVALPQGSHFNERTKVHKNDFSNDGKDLVMMVEYYGSPNNNRKAKTVYVLYDGGFQELDLAFGSSRSGFYMNHFDVPTKCKPYAFVVVDQDDNIHRLPEEEEYFFATRTEIQEMGKNGKHWSLEYPCEENHYYYNGNSWKANGGKKVGGSGGSCKGCSEAATLASLYKTFIKQGTVTAADPDAYTADDVTSNDGMWYGNDEASCVVISRLYGLNGEYNDAGSVWNGKTVYKQGSNYLYVVEDEGSYYWVISGTKGSASWSKGWCSENDILDCGGNWNTGGSNGKDTNCEFKSCTGSGSFSLYDDLEDGCEVEYNDKLCIDGNTRNDILWDEGTAQFEANGKCSHYKPVYVYTSLDESIYYLHYYKNETGFGSDVQWIISKDTIDVGGSAKCFNDDLMQCVEDLWFMEKLTIIESNETMGNFTIYEADPYFERFLDENMRIYNSGCDSMQERGIKSSIIAFIVVSVLLLLIVTVCGIIWLRWKHNRVHRHNIKAIANDSDEEMEIEKVVINTTGV